MQARLVGDEIVNTEEQCEWFLSVERQAEIARQWYKHGSEGASTRIMILCGTVGEIKLRGGTTIFTS